MSTLIPNAVPASLRKPVESARYGAALISRAVKPVLVSGVDARAQASAKGSFEFLPQEPEDARMTGVTRSLNRRLLALNVSGSLIRTNIRAASRIA